MYQLDHVVIAAADLEHAKAAFADETGVLPIDGGPHLGLGTRNALASFGESYLEIIAPDPAQALEGTMGARLADLDEPRLLHWAIRVDDLERYMTLARECGLDPTPARRTSRRTPQGVALTWQLFGVRGHSLGGLVPFFIDWLDCPHPSQSAPRVGAVELTVTLPRGSSGARLLREPPRGVTIATGAQGMKLAFRSPRGKIEMNDAAPAGFGL